MRGSDTPSPSPSPRSCCSARDDAVPSARDRTELARTQLYYGERLRRASAPARARHYLALTAEAFHRLGAAPWADRAGQELRACGGPGRTASTLEAAVLTPQQREIAQLAAAGLSNKQIGKRLYLSPRTVSTHLYQVFPKLGVTSRAALRDALDGVSRNDADSAPESTSHDESGAAGVQRS